MAIATRTLKDTKLESGSGAQGGKVTVLVTMNDNTTADSVVLDASALAGHANGAMLDITRIWWGLVQGTVEYKKLSPKMRDAINDVYSMINRTTDPIVSKIEGIIRAVSRKHGVSTYDIEDYFDNELIK